MPLTKLVDGQRVEMTAEEEQAILDDWNTVDPITHKQVNAERDRRIALGVSVTTSVVGTFTMQTRPGDIQNIQALVQLARIRKDAADTTPIVFRDADNIDRTLTPDEMIAAGLQAFAHVDHHYKKAWALKEQDPIPTDYTNNIHWT